GGEHGAAMTARLPDDARLGRVRLRVADLGRALGFYEGVLGLRRVRDEGPLVGLAPGTGSDAPESGTAPHEIIVLQEVPGISRRPRRPVTAGLYHVALLVPSRRDLGRALLALYDAGYPLRGMSDHAVSESLYLDDPDGNGLEIYADRPRAEWPVRDGIVQMTVEPMDHDGVIAAGRVPPAPWRGLPSATVVGHVHLTVSRLEPSLAFYHEVVGFDLMMRIPSLAAVSAGGYHHHLNLNTWAGEGAPPDSEGVAGLAGWELRVPGAEARRALAARLGERHVESSNGLVSARDPDGALMEVVGA
ncbi:MAG: VOC family protein, partial [Nocardioidaceae bacterium]